MSIATLEQLEAAAETVYGHVAPTPQIAWPLLARRAGCEVWVKHENHTPIGAFKVRGGLVYLEALRGEHPQVAGVVSATRGNHGQSLAFAAARFGLSATIVVPHGNNPEKNAAMEALGAELVEFGTDFEDALGHAGDLAAERRLHLVPSFHPNLVRGVGTYSLELLRAVPDIHTAYVPIGLGSGICGMIAARDAVGLGTRIVGVVAEEAPAYALSFAAGEPVPTNSSATLADGIAVRVPDKGALELIRAGAERIVAVSEDAILAAMHHYFIDTHNLAEGAGAAPLAALLAEAGAMKGKRVALVLSGGNLDRALMARVLEAA